MMSGQVSAEIGHWYRPIDNDNLFEVVAIDYDEQMIEIQNFDGNIEEMEFTGWKALIPVEIAPPEDWTGPYEIAREDPLGSGGQDQRRVARPVDDVGRRARVEDAVDESHLAPPQLTVDCDPAFDVVRAFTQRNRARGAGRQRFGVDRQHRPRLRHPMAHHADAAAGSCRAGTAHDPLQPQ